MFTTIKVFMLNIRSVWITGGTTFLFFTWLRLLLDLLGVIILYLAFLFSFVHLLSLQFVELRHCKFTQRRRELIFVLYLLNFMFFLVLFGIVRTRRLWFLFVILLFNALEKSQIVFENGFSGDGKTAALHIFLNVLHLVLNAVFAFELSFCLEMLKYLKDDFSLFLRWFFSTRLFALLFSLNFHEKIPIKVLLQMIFQGFKLVQLL